MRNEPDVAAREGLPLRALRTFLVAARCNRYADAAQKLGVTPSAVSHQIKALEDWLGVAIFLRSTKRPTLTEAGRVLLDGCSLPLLQIEEICEGLRRSTDPERIVISAPPAFASFRLLGRLDEFRRRGAQIRPEVRLSRFDADLEPGIDVAIRFLHHHSSARRIGLPGWSVVSAPAYDAALGRPRAPGDLRQGVLVHEEAFNYWPLVFQEAGVPVPPDIRYFGLGDATHVLSAALSGTGIALLPHELTLEFRRNGALISNFMTGIEASAGYFWLLARPDSLDPRLAALTAWLTDGADREAEGEPPRAAAEITRRWVQSS